MCKEKNNNVKVKAKIENLYLEESKGENICDIEIDNSFLDSIIHIKPDLCRVVLLKKANHSLRENICKTHLIKYWNKNVQTNLKKP